MSKTKEIIEDVGSYSSALMLTQLVTAVAAVLTRRFLGPVQVGVWTFVQVILSYSEYAGLGTLSAVALEIPFYNGKGNHEKATNIKNTVFSFSLLTSVLLAAGVVVFAFLRRESLQRELFYGLLFTSVLVVLQKLNGLWISLIRAFKKFGLAGRQMFYSAIVNAVLVAFLSYYFKLYGFMLAMCLSFLFNLVYISVYQKFDFRLRLNRAELFPLIAYGLPLMVITLFTTFFETIDQLMITNYLGFEALGFYGVGLMAFNYINSVPNAVGIVVIPNLQEKYGQSEKKSDLRGFLNKSDFLVTGLISLLIGISWFAAPPLVRLVLPKFAPGIPAMRFLLLGTFFVAVSQAYLQFIYVIRKHLLLLPFTALSCFMAFLFNWAAIRGGFGIEGVAVATSLAIFFNFTLICFYASRQVFEVKEFFGRYFFVLSRFALMLALLFLLAKFVRVKSPILTAVLQALLFSAAYVPFLAECSRRFDLFAMVRRKIFKK